MCTAITYRTRDHYFGRTLDLEYSYCESVTVAPRSFPFRFRHVRGLEFHHAMIGMAYVVEEYPLYYDATNEKGLSMAGLRFQGNACFHKEAQGKDNVAPFELIPWVLGQCESVSQARKLLGRINVVEESFNQELPVSPLHWIIADESGAIVVECVRDGVKVYEDPVGVLTNNPPFETQLFNLNNYLSLTAKMPENRFSDKIKLDTYSLGMGGLGLPGDMSSVSRFVRGTFVKLNSVSGTSEDESVSQFFHIMDSIAQVRGCVETKDGRYELTVYTSCCNAARGIYYYTTYENRGITAVDLHREDLNGEGLVSYPLQKEQRVEMLN